MDTREKLQKQVIDSEAEVLALQAEQDGIDVEIRAAGNRGDGDKLVALQRRDSELPARIAGARATHLKARIALAKHDLDEAEAAAIPLQEANSAAQERLLAAQNEAREAFLIWQGQRNEARAIRQELADYRRDLDRVSREAVSGSTLRKRPVFG